MGGERTDGQGVRQNLACVKTKEGRCTETDCPYVDRVEIRRKKIDSLPLSLSLSHMHTHSSAIAHFLLFSLSLSYFLTLSPSLVSPGDV